MGAITGYFNFKRVLNQETKADFEKAMFVQNHRGPDASQQIGVSFADQTFLDEYVDSIINGLFGYNSLFVTNENIAQPIVSKDNRVVLAFDGEIYNLPDIKLEFEEKYGLHYKNSYDVLISMYMEYGFSDMLNHLNGVFAFALVDLNKRTVFIGSDRYGAKPLYFWHGTDGRLIFASEAKAIIQFRDFERKIDLDAYNARLVFARPGSKVLLEGVSLVYPGTVHSFSLENENVEKYFDINNYKRNYTQFRSIDDAIDALDVLLEKAVRRQMVNGKRLGVQLSGGIDSTLLAYYAKKIGADNFSEAVAIVDGKGELGEEHYIKYVSDKLGLNLYKTILTPDYFMTNYERMIWHNDAPVYRPYFACFMRLGELAKQRADILFCGEGADEVAGGYSRFAAGYLYPFMASVNSGNPKFKTYDSYAKYAAMAAETHTNFLTNDWTNADCLIEQRMDLFNSFSGTNLDKHLKFEIIECLPEASMRQDKMTMANSIENRVPLLDNDVVDFIMTLPEDMLVRFVADSPAKCSDNPFNWMQGKYILKEIVAKYFGRDFAYRKKMIMNIDDVGVISSNEFRSYFNEIVYPKMASRGIVNADQVKTWFENATSISKAEFTMMWRAISLETWCKLFIDMK